MTTPPVIAVAALLAVLAVAVAFRALGSFGRRGRGLDGGSFRTHGRGLDGGLLWSRGARLVSESFLERRSRRGRRWFPGSSRSWRRRSPKRRRQSALLDRPAYSSTSPIVANSDRPSTPRRSAGPTATSTAATASNAGLGRSSAAGRVRTRISMPGRAAARRREMEEAVPEVVDVLRATVAAGINPRRALQAAAEGTPSALSDVLGQAIRAAELGAGAGQALAAAAKAERLSELELAGEALDLAETTGAPPGPVLAGVAIAATDRVRSRQAVLAATAQARLSARVVAAMAPAFLGIVALTSPSDAAFLIREPAGWATLTAATVLELLGICWAARIVRGPAP
jgi:hypothetical protein